jgi:hypothetical protein
MPCVIEDNIAHLEIIGIHRSPLPGVALPNKLIRHVESHRCFANREVVVPRKHKIKRFAVIAF